MMGESGSLLFHIFINCLAQIVNCLLIAFPGGVDDAVLKMVLQYDFAGVVNGAPDGGDLDQHFGAIPAFLHHAPHGLQMPDGPAQAVEHGLGVLVGMGMAVGTVAVPVIMVVVMVVIMVMAVADAQPVHDFVGLFFGGNIVDMLVLHGIHLAYAAILPYESIFCKPGRGIFSPLRFR